MFKNGLNIVLGIPIPQSVYAASSNSELAGKTVDLSLDSSQLTQAWRPSPDDEEQFVQIYFDTEVTVVQLLLQGAIDSGYWTETFELSITRSENSAVWEPVTNSDGSLVSMRCF